MFIWSISGYEYLSCFRYHNIFIKKIQKYKECINLSAYMLPHWTLSSILISSHENQEDLQVPTQQSSKSPLSTLFKKPKSESSATILNGIVYNSLSSEDTWSQEYKSDPDTNNIKQMLQNPSTINESKLKDIPFIYRQPMQDSMIKLEFGKIKMYKKIVNCMEIIKQILVPKGLWKMIFQTFHANPSGAHFSLYYTLHQTRIRYHWPKMYEDIKK